MRPEPDEPVQDQYGPHEEAGDADAALSEGQDRQHQEDTQRQRYYRQGVAEPRHQPEVGNPVARRGSLDRSNPARAILEAWPRTVKRAAGERTALTVSVSRPIISQQLNTANALIESGGGTGPTKPGNQFGNG